MQPLYDQQKLWTTKWGSGYVKRVNAYAKRCLAEIQKRDTLHTLLDLGCGAGQDAAFFASHGLDVTAADFTEAALRFIPINTPHLTSILLDMNHLTLKKRSFDVIYAHLSLHYFDDETTTAIFHTLYDALRPGGLMFVKCKSTDDAFYGLGEHIGPDMFCKDNQIRHFFTKEYLGDKLAEFHVLNLKKTSSVYMNYRSAFVEAIVEKVDN